MKLLDDLTLIAEAMLAVLAFSGALSAWRSRRPFSVFCALAALGMALGALTYGAFFLILSRRPEGAMMSRVPGQLPGMGALFALTIGLPGGLILAFPLTLVRWLLNREGIERRFPRDSTGHDETRGPGGFPDRV